MILADISRWKSNEFFRCTHQNSAIAADIVRIVIRTADALLITAARNFIKNQKIFELIAR